MPGGDTAETGGRLLVIGADHRTAPPAWRDQFAIIEANLGSELDRLRAKGFGDLTLLATCERIEFITIGTGTEVARRKFAMSFAERLGTTPEHLASALYAHEGERALRHLFAVASSLQSLVLGEPHILGQLRSAHRIASEAGLVTCDLEAALQGARVGGRRGGGASTAPGGAGFRDRCGDPTACGARRQRSRRRFPLYSRRSRACGDSRAECARRCRGGRLGCSGRRACRVSSPAGGAGGSARRRRGSAPLSRRPRAAPPPPP